MKKFTIGLLCGIILSFATTAAASSEVRALLFPTAMSFHLNGNSSTAGPDDAVVLNYGNRIYVPLRFMAEQMGATVRYQAPANTGGYPAVEVYAVDERDLTIREEGGHFGIGHVAVAFRKQDDVPTISGMIKMWKPLPQGKQAVIEIYDEQGELAATSEYIKLNAADASMFDAANDVRYAGEMEAGEIAKFETRFPYMAEIENYRLQVKAVEQEPWHYEQAYEGSITDGAGGMSGYPLAMWIGLDKYEAAQGQPVTIRAGMLNLSEHSIALTEPASFRVLIARAQSDFPSVAASLTTAPLQGTIYWKKGSRVTQIVWDQKDSSGKQVPPGEYIVTIELPQTVHGTSTDMPDRVQSFEIASSLRTMVPLTIR